MENRGFIKKFSPHEGTSFGKSIAIISGKGGVGKSLVSTLLAVSLRKEGKEAALIDADITGPSICKGFGKDNEDALGDDNGIEPIQTKSGISIIGANNFLEDPTAPIVWRGGLITSLVGRMYSEVRYGPKDFLLIDMPPGTGDVPLTVFQSMPIDGVIVVSSPQDLVSDVVRKSIKMANMMGVKVYGLVMNMAYATCPHCGERFEVFGHLDSNSLAKEMGIDILSEIPIDPSLNKLIDDGNIEEYNASYLDKTVKMLLK